jgi:hypothetical protein
MTELRPRAPRPLRAGAWIGLALATAGWVSPLFSQQLSFRKIAESGSGTTDFGLFPAINASGTVAYIREATDGLKGVYTRGTGAETRIADSSGPFFDFSGVQIDESGRVCFQATLDAGGSGIYAGKGGKLETIAETGATYSQLEDGPAMNASGAIAYRATLADGSRALHLNQNGETTTIADSAGGFKNFSATPALNDSGTLAFAATFDAGGSGVFTGNGQSLTTLAVTTPTLIAWTDPSINAAGAVLSTVFHEDGVLEMVRFDGGKAGALVTSGDVFTSFGRPLINASGKIAFTAYRDGVGTGIYTGSRPGPDTVLQHDAKLFDSYLYQVYLSTQALNDAGQIAFFYELENGRTGIGVVGPMPRRPVLSLLGKTRVELKKSLVTLRGSALAEGGLSSVEVSYRQSSRGKSKMTRRLAAVSGESWNFQFRASESRTTLSIRAIDRDGQTSPPVEVEVRRR